MRKVYREILICRVCKKNERAPWSPTYCKSCANEKLKAYLHAHPEKVRKYTKTASENRVKRFNDTKAAYEKELADAQGV